MLIRDIDTLCCIDLFDFLEDVVLCSFNTGDRQQFFRIDTAFCQLITGFVVGDMEAVYTLSGTRGMLSARDGAYIYMIEAEVDEQTLYALGTAAYLEQTP